MFKPSSSSWGHSLKPYVAYFICLPVLSVLSSLILSQLSSIRDVGMSARDILGLSGVGGRGGIYMLSFLLRIQGRVVPAPEWDAILNTKVFNKNIFNASHLHSSRFILPPLVLNKFLITGADNLNSVSWFPCLGLCVKMSLSLQRRQWQFRGRNVLVLHCCNELYGPEKKSSLGVQILLEFRKKTGF